MTRPFPLPSDLPKADPLRDWRRSFVARAVGIETSQSVAAAVRSLWPTDEATQERIIRGVTAPASLTGWGSQLAGGAGAVFVRSLQATSAAANLFGAAGLAPMRGAATVSLPLLSSNIGVPTFVGEGEPIPVMQGSFGTVTLGTPKKLAMITALTGELRDRSADEAEAIIRFAMDDVTSKRLDQAVFSTTSASATTPAGLLNGVTAIPATTGGGVTAMAKDLANLVGAISDAGGGADIAIYMNPRQAVTVQILGGAELTYPIVPAPTLAPGTIVAIERRAIASGFPALPDVQVERDATLHFETAPAQIATAGAIPAQARIQSAFQSDLIALRLILRCAWVSMLPGGVQFITGATW